MTGLLPSGPARWCVSVAIATWLGVAAGLGSRVAVAMCVAAAGALVVRKYPIGVLAAFCVLGVGSGLVSSARSQAIESVQLPTGSVEVTLRVAEDPSSSTYGLAVAEITAVGGVAWEGPRVAVVALPEHGTVGSTLVAVGRMTQGVRRVRDEVVAGTFRVTRVLSLVVSPNPVVRGGNSIRDAVGDRYDGTHRADGLLSGFLTGDTDAMTATDEEDLRRAGLAHFVAVSGSNVALFLGIWWVVTAPLSIHPRIRVLVGGVGLLLFAVVTRWEPSVIRASVMASVLLAGGLLGIPVDPWMALGVAVTVLLLVSGHLALSVGFQLSVLATAGVLVGLAIAKGRRPRWLYVPLFSTIGAQAAVAPLLLVVFGTVPLLAPLTNLVMSPVIAVTTIVAAIGVAVPPFADLARVSASFVLGGAGVTSGGPQLGVFGVVTTLGVVAGLSVRSIRPIVAGVGIVVAAVAVPWTHQWPRVPTLTVLDVGQGDAILIQAPDGSTLLVDGGSDPRVLDRALRRNGVRSVDTVVVSHDDLDHAGGLTELVAGRRVGKLVVSRFVSDSELVAVATASGTLVERVEAGDRIGVGVTTVVVLSPSRRYASDNDGSIVLFVHSDVSVLLPGDAEAIALRELPPVSPDVMVVPHHGSGTTDLRWLDRTLGSVAILSYGPNRYGHPHPDVVASLVAAGVIVHRTDEVGDVTVELTTQSP